LRSHAWAARPTTSTWMRRPQLRALTGHCNRPVRRCRKGARSQSGAALVPRGDSASLAESAGPYHWPNLGPKGAVRGQVHSSQPGGKGRKGMVSEPVGTLIHDSLSVTEITTQWVLVRRAARQWRAYANLLHGRWAVLTQRGTRRYQMVRGSHKHRSGCRQPKCGPLIVSPPHRPCNRCRMRHAMTPGCCTAPDMARVTAPGEDAGLVRQ
jgi:hypothetical protein